MATKSSPNWPTLRKKPTATIHFTGTAGRRTSNTAGNAVSAKRTATNSKGGNVSSPTSMATKLTPHSSATDAARTLWRSGIGRRRNERGALAPIADSKQRDEEGRERADPGRVGDRSHTDRAAEEPARCKHRDLHRSAHDANRVAAGGEAGHHAGARAGAEAGTDVRTGRDAVQDDAAEHRGGAQRQHVRRRNRRQRQGDDETDHDDVAERPQPRTLAQRDPKGEDTRADDDRPRSDAEPEPPRQPLVQDVPGIDAEAAEEEQSVTEAVQGEPGVELAQSPKTRRRQHQASVTVNGLAPVGPFW